MKRQYLTEEKSMEQLPENNSLDSILEIYKTRGLIAAIKNLCMNSDNLQEDFAIFLNQVYEKYNIDYKQNEILTILLTRIENVKEDTRNILQQNRGYKDGIPKFAEDKINTNSDIYNKSIEELINYIDKDLTLKYHFRDQYLLISEFIKSTVNKQVAPTKEFIYHQLVHYFRLRGFTIPYTTTLENYLKEIIRIVNIKNNPKKQEGSFDLSDEYLKIAIDNLVDYIKDIIKHEANFEEIAIYFEINEINEENERLYNQIQNIQNQIELNETQKRKLTLKYQNI